MILNALVERLKRRSKDDVKGRHFEATLILQAVSWYLRYPDHCRCARGKIGERHVPLPFRRVLSRTAQPRAKASSKRV